MKKVNEVKGIGEKGGPDVFSGSFEVQARELLTMLTSCANAVNELLPPEKRHEEINVSDAHLHVKDSGNATENALRVSKFCVSHAIDLSRKISGSIATLHKLRRAEQQRNCE